MIRLQHSKIWLCLILLFSTLSISCDKDDNNEIGPDGPQGPAGAQGATGANGTIEIFSKTVTVNANDWYSYNTSTNSNDSVNIAIPEITQAIIDSGMVVCYKLDGSVYKSMPFSVYDGLAEQTFQFYYYPGNLVITCNSNFVGGNILGNETFRAVIANGHLRLMPGEINANEFNVH